MNNTLLQFKEVVDEEIQAYENLGELYQIKQSYLIQGKSDALWDIDAQIVDQAKDIRELNKKRKEVAGYLGNENFTMTDIIEKAKFSNDELLNSLESQKIKLKLLSKTLSLQEKTNMSLVKHGLNMVGKTLDIFMKAISPEAQGQYNHQGQNIKSENLVSSVVKDA